MLTWSSESSVICWGGPYLSYFGIGLIDFRLMPPMLISEFIVAPKKEELLPSFSFLLFFL
jgi:hypothetical protein